MGVETNSYSSVSRAYTYKSKDFCWGWGNICKTDLSYVSGLGVNSNVCGLWSLREVSNSNLYGSSSIFDIIYIFFSLYL